MKYITIFLAVFMLGTIIAFPKTIYVKYDAEGLNNGTNWNNAFLLVQSALDVAVSGDEIWVSAGNYYPTKQVGGEGERFRTYQMKNGVAIFGGFAGDETDKNDRDWGVKPNYSKW